MSFDYYGRRRSSGSNTIAVVSFFILVISLIALGAVHLLVWLVDRDIAQMKATLKAQEERFQPEEINTFKRFDERLKLAEGVLANHTVVSEVFALLSARTLPTVRFTSFNFTEEFIDAAATGASGESAKPAPRAQFSVSLEGEAGGFRDIVFQAIEFEKVKTAERESDRFILSSSFSDFRSKEDGRVSFSVDVILNPALVRYGSFIERLPLERAEDGGRAETPPRRDRAVEEQTP